MQISGFSMVRNGVKLYYPVVEMIKSILPLVDEFVIAIGKGDPDDDTREQVTNIDSSKIKIIDTVWKEKYFKKGIVNAIQTDIAKNECEGDWLFYLQADEVVHEKYLPVIKARCEELLDKKEIEGILFNYKHFWGDYRHYHIAHGWYPREIRIIRNREDIHSWRSAQSFRKFDYYNNPRQPEGHHKLTVAEVDAEIFHYGWVRPPHLMQNKRKALSSVHMGKKKARKYYDKLGDEFDYGPLNKLAEYQGTHPLVMQDRIQAMDWKDKLQYSGKRNPMREIHKHEKLKNRLVGWIERKILGGRQIGGSKNYILKKNV
jgi:hypothetical protein